VPVRRDRQREARGRVGDLDELADSTYDTGVRLKDVRGSLLDQLGERIPELNYNIGVMLQQANLQEDAARSYRRAIDDKADFGEAFFIFPGQRTSAGVGRTFAPRAAGAVHARKAKAARPRVAGASTVSGGSTRAAPRFCRAQH